MVFHLKDGFFGHPIWAKSIPWKVICFTVSLDGFYLSKIDGDVGFFMTKEYFSNFRSLNSKIITKYLGRGITWSLKYESINGSIHDTGFGSHSRTGSVTDMLKDIV